MKKITLIFLVIIAAAFSSILVIPPIPTAAQEKQLTIAGLKEPVTVRRDARAVPYIEAKNEADMHFAQGYVTASDRLFQMDLTRRVARGETAELFGSLGLGEDKYWRKLSFARICDESYKMLTPELKASLDDYTRGVNAYIATLTPETLPGEYKILQAKPREWVPTDSLMIGKILSEALSDTWQQDLVRVSINQLPAEKAAMLNSKITDQDVVLFDKDVKKAVRRASASRRVYEGTLPDGRISAIADDLKTIAEVRRASLAKTGLYAEENAASNNWVISGKLTQDGKPMLANDPHLTATAPGIWYLINLSMPGMRVSGVSLPGTPGVTLGHNEHIAWGATNLGPDVQDVYIETPETMRNATVRQEQIKVRKNPLGPIAEQNIETLDVKETRNGVVLVENAGQTIAMKWTAFDPKNMELGAFYYLNRAKDWAGFNKALKTYGGATQNFVYADVKGNIGWHTAGAIPIRKTGDGALPYDGAKTDGDWTGTIPYDEMPNLYNPPGGYIVTANQRVVGTANKYFSILSRDAATPWRARRITDMIEYKVKRGKLTMDDSAEIQFDVFNIPLFDFAVEVDRIKGGSPTLIGQINAGGHRMKADSKEALLVNEVRVVFADKLAEANLVDKDGKRLNIPTYWLRERAALNVLKSNDKSWLPKGYATYRDLLLDCEKQAQLNLNALAARVKKERAMLVWGDNFTANFFHPLGAVPLIGGAYLVRSIEVNGSGQTPNVGAAVSMRHIAVPGNWDATRQVIPLGQSGDPGSPHWKDQFEAWRTGKTPVFPFSKEVVEKAAANVVLMVPGK